MKMKFAIIYLIMTIGYYSLLVIFLKQTSVFVAFISLLLIYIVSNVMWLITCMKIGKIVALPYIYIINILPLIGNVIFWIMEIESKRINFYKLNKSNSYNYIETQIKPYIKTVDNSKISMLFTGKEFFEKLNEKILNAKSYIYMDYYILRADDTGNRIIKNLKYAASKGVMVYIMYDPYGSNKGISKIKKLSKEKNIEVARFIKGGFLGRFINIRNHLKMTVIDEFFVITGGSNIGNEYNNLNINFTWDDHNVILSGDVAKSYSDIFKYNWKLATGEKIAKRTSVINEKYNEHVKVVINQPNSNISPLLYTYLKMLINARKKVVIYTPYYSLTESLYENIFMLRIDGVEIEMFIGEKPDHKFVYMASKYAIERLINADVKVYQVKNTFVHTKMLLVDDEKLFLGNGNFDVRSCYFNYEVNILTYNEEEICKVKEKVERDKGKSILITKEVFKRDNNFFKRFLNYATSLFSRFF